MPETIVQPLYDKIVIARDKPVEQTEGGLYLPASSRGNPNVGTVVAVGNGILGPDGMLTDLSTKVGDRVVFSAYSGSKIEVDGAELLVMAESEVLVILKPGA